VGRGGGGGRGELPPSPSAAGACTDRTPILCKSCRKGPRHQRRAARSLRRENERRRGGGSPSSPAPPLPPFPLRRDHVVDDVKIATRASRCPAEAAARWIARHRGGSLCGRLRALRLNFSPTRVPDVIIAYVYAYMCACICSTCSSHLVHPRGFDRARRIKRQRQKSNRIYVTSPIPDDSDDSAETIAAG